MRLSFILRSGGAWWVGFVGEECGWRDSWQGCVCVSDRGEMGTLTEYVEDFFFLSFAHLDIGFYITISFM